MAVTRRSSNEVYLLVVGGVATQHRDECFLIINMHAWMGKQLLQMHLLLIVGATLVGDTMHVIISSTSYKLSICFICSFKVVPGHGYRS